MGVATDSEGTNMRDASGGCSSRRVCQSSMVVGIFLEEGVRGEEEKQIVRCVRG